jgi:hypothetical protein
MVEEEEEEEDDEEEIERGREGERRFQALWVR